MPLGDMSNTWGEAQAWGNVIEMGMQIYSLWLIFGRKATAPLWVFTTSALTLFKTILYVLVGGLMADKVWAWRNPSLFIPCFVLPTSVWFIMPTICIFICYPRITQALSFAYVFEQSYFSLFVQCWWQETRIKKFI